MTRALPTAAPARTRRRFTPPWARARIVAAHPIRTELIHVRSEVEARALSSNPNVEILSVKTQSTGRWLVKVRYTDRKVSVLPPPRLPFRVEGLRGWAAVMLTALAVPAALAVGVKALWAAHGGVVADTAETVGAGVAVLAVAALAAWLLTPRKRGCAGLHCSGCSKH